MSCFFYTRYLKYHINGLVSLANLFAVILFRQDQIRQCYLNPCNTEEKNTTEQARKQCDYLTIISGRSSNLCMYHYACIPEDVGSATTSVATFSRRYLTRVLMQPKSPSGHQTTEAIAIYVIFLKIKLNFICKMQLKISLSRNTQQLFNEKSI